MGNLHKLNQKIRQIFISISEQLHLRSSLILSFFYNRMQKVPKPVKSALSYKFSLKSTCTQNDKNLQQDLYENLSWA